MDGSADRDPVDEELPSWQHAGSNLLLDFHGDPSSADLIVFSDGNHHMALKETLEQFGHRAPGLKGIFYATTPPGPIVALLRHGRLQLGNFVLSVTPHLFIAPPQVLDGLVEEGYITHQQPFVRNQGNVLLVKRGNPKGLTGVDDLKRSGISVFLSNPDTETASHRVYRDTLINLSGDPEIEANLKIVYGQRIHHREAPVAVLRGRADAAVIFYHLALYFTRRFPNEFEMVPLGGTTQKPDPHPGNHIGSTHAGLIGSGGVHGQSFLDFLTSKAGQAIYRHHGLIPL